MTIKALLKSVAIISTMVYSMAIYPIIRLSLEEQLFNENEMLFTSMLAGSIIYIVMFLIQALSIASYDAGYEAGIEEYRKHKL